jgi:Fe-S cluster biogenesis protein NfuA
MARPEDQAFLKRVEHLEQLINAAEQWADAETRRRVQEIVRTLLDLHGAALEKVLEHAAGAGEPGRALIDALSQDSLVGHILLLHGLHPLDLESRVRQALDGVQSQLQAHGGAVELLDVTDGVVRLRLQRSDRGNHLSAVNLKRTVEEAIYQNVPDVEGVAIDDGEHAAVPDVNGRARRALPLVQAQAV